MYDYSRAVSKASGFRQLIGLSESQLFTEFHLEKVLTTLACLGIRVYTYKQLAKVGSVDELIELWGPDGAAVIKSNKKFIVLNNFKKHEFDTVERSIWTFLHEVGHFFLGHLKARDCTCLRSGKYSWFESETNVFVANVLLPEEAIAEYVQLNFAECQYIDCNQLACMRNDFYVSWSALTARLDFLNIQSSSFSNFLIGTYRRRKDIALENDVCINSVDMQKYTIRLWAKNTPQVYKIGS